MGTYDESRPVESIFDIAALIPYARRSTSFQIILLFVNSVPVEGAEKNLVLS